MVDSDNVKTTQLSEALVSNGFSITREELMELFVTENMHLGKNETGTPKSIKMLQSMNYASEVL